MGPIELLEGLRRIVDRREDLPPEALPLAIDTLADGLAALMLAPRAEAVELATLLMERGFEGASMLEGLKPEQYQEDAPP